MKVIRTLLIVLALGCGSPGADAPSEAESSERLDFWETGDFVAYKYLVDTRKLPPGTLVDPRTMGAPLRKEVTLVSYLPSTLAETAGLVPGAVIGLLASPEADVRPDTLLVNGSLRNLIQELAAADRPPGLLAAAKRQGDGYVAVIDARAIDPMGEVPSADVLGVYRVKEGVVVGYDPNEHYALLTEAGLFRLTPSLRLALKERVLAESSDDRR